ncbi:AAA family ATPase [Rhizobium leguminosarum]|uniref:AAA family ATPase n=1 Tax=Rhizobium leguminosarum TaxID=384 RepID=UPI0036DE78C9
MADGLLEWADKQADWVRDALRRHAQHGGFSLSDEHKKHVRTGVRLVAGYAIDPVPDHEALASSHLKSAAAKEPRAILCSLGSVRNLNRLAEGQTLKFALNGLTLIYGDNGSGKSGYCRITKKLCRSLTLDELLGNVFEAGTKPPAEVQVRFIEEGAVEPQEVVWIDGTPTPQPISRISVFDSANARLYVDKQNRIGFLPADIAILERHGTHRGELEAEFRAEIKALEAKLKTPMPGGYSPTGTVAALLARLDPKSKVSLPAKSQIKDQAEFSDADNTELGQLAILLASDPSTMATKRRRAKAALEKIAAAALLVEARLSDGAWATLAEQIAAAGSTASAAKLAAASAFKTLPLADVGQAPWRLMFDYARAYAVTLGGDHEHVPSKEGDLCLLCQEPLTAEAAERMSSFNAFVTGAANMAAQKAATTLHASQKAIVDLNIPDGDEIQAALGEFGDLSLARKEVIAVFINYFAIAANRRSSFVASAASEAPLAPSLAATISEQCAQLAAEASDDDNAAKDDTTRAATRKRRDELTDRKKLGADLAIVLARLDDLEERLKLLECCEAVETGSVSRQMTALRRSLVMEHLENRILDEIQSLGLSHIPFSVNDRSQDGQSYFEVGLAAQKATANNRVLSEGEQRALALACFLAEAGGDTSRHGLIIDDPVSSLDHLRVRKVASRLVGEAANGRQVIIFTHNLLFFNEVVDAAAQSMPPVPIVRNYISKNEASGFGIISETDEPWIAQPVTKRIATLRDRLKAFKEIANQTDESWRRLAKDFYTDLRESWERLVEEVLLGKVVERFNTDVRTQSLKVVSVEDEDYKRVYWAMKRVSERSGHDMAAGKILQAPTLLEMKSDLDAIEEFRTEVAKRRKANEERRAAFEKPPKAETI